VTDKKAREAESGTAAPARRRSAISAKSATIGKADATSHDLLNKRTRRFGCDCFSGRTSDRCLAGVVSFPGRVTAIPRRRFDGPVGYGGTIFPDRSRRLGDLDTFAVVERVPDERTKSRLEQAEAEIAREHGIYWDIWYVLAADAGRSEPPPMR